MATNDLMKLMEATLRLTEKALTRDVECEVCWNCGVDLKPTMERRDDDGFCSNECMMEYHEGIKRGPEDDPREER